MPRLVRGVQRCESTPACSPAFNFRPSLSLPASLLLSSPSKEKSAVSLSLSPPSSISTTGTASVRSLASASAAGAILVRSPWEWVQVEPLTIQLPEIRTGFGHGSQTHSVSLSLSRCLSPPLSLSASLFSHFNFCLFHPAPLDVLSPLSFLSLFLSFSLSHLFTHKNTQACTYMLYIYRH